MPSIKFLWIIDFDYPTRLHHGAVMRFVNYSRELLLRGHRVYLAVMFDPKYRNQSSLWFASLKNQGFITDFFELSYLPLRRYTWLAARAMYPGLANYILRKFQGDTGRAVEEIIERCDIDVTILSNRRLLFLASNRLWPKPCLIDFCDCTSLYVAREISHSIRCKQYWRSLRTLPHFISVLSEDRYYAQRSTANIVVSPADNLALGRIAGGTAKIFTILNGVILPTMPNSPDKIPNRLIFSGNMDFPPNFTAALWFLDRVFPSVLEHLPDARLVLAGANPPDFLKKRASRNITITGYVEDLNREIASSVLYVAPLTTGSGFKNKIVEAIANRTYVVATALAVEFLDPFTRSLIGVTNSAQEMADLIVSLLPNPFTFESRLSSVYDHVRSTFTWPRRTDELLEVVAKSVNGK